MQADEPGAPVTIDPLADLLLSLGAIVILAVIVMLPLAQIQTGKGRPDAARPSATFMVAGREAQPVLATAHGIVLGPGTSDRFGLDGILDDARLAGKLSELSQTGAPVLFLIEPRGQEAAFLFETLAGGMGITSLLQVRLDSDCDHARSGSPALCLEQLRRRLRP